MFTSHIQNINAMRKINILLSLFIFSVSLFAQEVKPVKNIIVMIPDGTSIGVYSAAAFKNYGMRKILQLPYLTELSHFSSNAPIGDSAPTGSTYATGVLQQSGNVAIHPEVSDNDLFPVDGTRTWQPAATILEALKIEKRKAVGLVVTCEFPHATPADFSAHHYKRRKYDDIATQMASKTWMSCSARERILPMISDRFQKKRNNPICNDRMHSELQEGKSMALFGTKHCPIHRQNPDRCPPAEMTESIQLLSKEEKFFLMVKGVSNWAHATCSCHHSRVPAFDEAWEKRWIARYKRNTAVLSGRPRHSGLQSDKKLPRNDKFSGSDLQYQKLRRAHASIDTGNQTRRHQGCIQRLQTFEYR